MNVEIKYFALFIVFLIILARKKPHYLYFVWAASLLVFPTTRTFVVSIPFYWYDIVALFLIARLYIGRELRNWPAHLPHWHWAFIIVAIVFGTMLPVLRYGWSREMLWILFHSSIAWMAFPIGVSLFISPYAKRYQWYLGAGLVCSLIAIAIMALLQFGNPTVAVAIDEFYFEDMYGEGQIGSEAILISSQRVTGPHQGPNELGGMSILAAAICALLFSQSSKWMAYCSTVCVSVIVALTVSRHQLLAVAVGFCVAGLFASYSARIRMIGGVIIIIVLAGLTGISQNWGERISRLENIQSDAGVIPRVVDGPKRLFSLFSKDPTVFFSGVGLEAARYAVKDKQNPGRNIMYVEGYVSNGFLLYFYYLGISGFVLVLVFWAWTFRRALLMSKNERWLGAGCVATAMTLIASDNYAFNIEVVVSLLFLIPTIIAGKSYTYRDETLAEILK